MKVTELRKIAEEYGVEYEGLSKSALLAQLAEEGVDDELIASITNSEQVVTETAEAPAPAVKRSGPEVLVFMNRANPTFEIKGHKFTKSHPFVAMSSDEAQEIFDYDPRGFRIATPNEVKEYYS
jgi:hypothetical protein